jgi:hypothetical protein
MFLQNGESGVCFCGILRKKKTQTEYKNMPKFCYTAKNIETGETVGGEQEAKDEHMLASDLRASGFLVTSMKEMKNSIGRSGAVFLIVSCRFH